MNSNYTHRALLLRLMLFALLIGGGTWAIFKESWEIAVLAFVLAIGVAINLLYFMQGVHRKLHFFFEAIKNEDGSLRFPKDQGDKHLQGLFQNMNRINEQINAIKVKQAQNEKFFMEFMKRSASGLIAVDPDGFVEIVNDAALKLIGLKNITHLKRLQQHCPALYTLILNLRPGQSQSLKLAENNELRQISVKEARISFSEKEYRIFSLYDIKNEMEENELETWQKLIRIMTHEIMNSIAPITSLSQTLSSFFKQEGSPIQVEKLAQKEIDNTVLGLSVISDRAEGLHSFVDNYRKLSRLPQPEFKAIELDNWLDSIRLLFENQRVENDITLQISNSYPPKEFLGDEKLLIHVILNLLNNATEALKGREDKRIEILVQQSETASLQIKISDNGKGFQPEERDKIFLPFYTTRENGSGIGLSLSRQIMRLHKGSISASSRPGLGSEFVIDC
tara:strand:- start:19911 stop:21260 length:1350 start_codon:yes stop_codon:yes gene_type:complete